MNTWRVLIALLLSNGIIFASQGDADQGNADHFSFFGKMIADSRVAHEILDKAFECENAGQIQQALTHVQEAINASERSGLEYLKDMAVKIKARLEAQLR